MPLSDAIDLIKPLRVAMLCIHSSPVGPLGTQDTGGMSVYVRELARWLGHSGHSVDIYTYAATDEDLIELYPNVRLIRLASEDGERVPKEHLLQKLNTVFDALEAYRRRHALTYDLIHSHYWLSGVLGAMAQARWHCPHLTMFHTLGMVKNLTASGENESDCRISHERWLAKMADAIVVPAEREKAHLLSFYKAQADKIRVIPCGVNLDLFRPGDKVAARRRTNLPQDRDVALFVGRFAPLKGLEALLGAVTQRPLLQLVVVGGDGPGAESTLALKHLAAALKIEDRVTFAGRVEQKRLPTYYQASDLLVVPSHYESFGLVVLEALACGIPVVATPVGAVEKIIRPDINGEVVSRSSSAMIADGIARVLQGHARKLYDPLKVRATVTHCGWGRIAADVIGVYGELIKSHRIHPPSEPAAACCSILN